MNSWWILIPPLATIPLQATPWLDVYHYFKLSVHEQNAATTHDVSRVDTWIVVDILHRAGLASRTPSDSFSCTSSNIIYLITCTKCKKQYVGLTTKQLSTRINHHRLNILNRKQIYVSVHFNFPDHSITNLSVQAIDKVPDQCAHPLQELLRLEKYWIAELKTWQPMGLNVSIGTIQ